MGCHRDIVLYSTLILVMACIICVHGDPGQEYIQMNQTYIGHGVQNLTVRSVKQCCVTCKADARCTSVSFEGQSSICQLNDRNPYADADVNVTHAPTWTSYKMKMAECSSPWILNDQNCYLVVTIEMAWPDAELYCQTFNGHLIDISDANEARFAFEAVQSAMGKATNFWIGLNDIAVDATFVYSSGASVSYENFAPGSPSYSNANDIQQDCILITTAEFWNDKSCTQTFPSVCEKNSY